ncbi:MAG: WecB/TagA/CpsF family glycosyltransferase [Azospirillaceae bacterium]|nr:WecB/TagA/CpsF family glycosyltransferase [Azospirillaceae bacterium]
MAVHFSDEASQQRIFGLRVTSLTVGAIVDRVVGTQRSAADGVGLVVTANIQHIALLRSNAALRAACASAAITTCDGFPVHYYARLRRCVLPGRVTGRDAVAILLRRAAFPAPVRLFFVVDHERTAQAVRDWAGQRGLGDRVATAIPPFGFERDHTLCQDLARTIRQHRTTILIMGVGAPRSETFVHEQRSILPPCWALCIGQGVKIALGLNPTPPALLVALNLEWFWRLCLEPHRLGLRYVRSAAGFLLAVGRDILASSDPGDLAPRPSPAGAATVAADDQRSLP